MPDAHRGAFDYDFGDTAGMTPLLPMYTLGHDFVPPPIHAGGLRYHGDSPIISNLVQDGRMGAVAYPQGKVFEAAVQFARTEGTMPAPETAHAIRAVIDEALGARSGARKRSSCSTTRATVSSTWPPTTTTSTTDWWTPDRCGERAAARTFASERTHASRDPGTQGAASKQATITYAHPRSTSKTKWSAV